MSSMCLFGDYVVSGDSSLSIRGSHGAFCWQYCQRGLFFVEFSAATTRQNVSVSFWEGTKLVTKVVPRCGRDVLVVKSNVDLIARLLCVISMVATNISCGGCSSFLINSLDKNPKSQSSVSIKLEPCASGKVDARTQFQCYGEGWHIFHVSNCISKTVWAIGWTLGAVNAVFKRRLFCRLSWFWPLVL